MAVKCFIRKAGRGNRVTLYALAQQSYSGETPGTAGDPGHRGSQALDTSPQHRHTPMCKSAQRLTHVHRDRHTGAQVGICLLADFQIAALGQRVLGHFPQGKMLSGPSLQPFILCFDLPRGLLSCPPWWDLILFCLTAWVFSTLGAETRLKLPAPWRPEDSASQGVWWDRGVLSSAHGFRNWITQLAFPESILCLGKVWAAWLLTPDFLLPSSQQRASHPTVLQPAQF